MDTLLLAVNSIACGSLALRLIFYSRAGAVHKPAISLAAYVIVVAAGSVPIRTAFGDYSVHDISETVINSVLCVAVFAVRGNLSQLFYRLGSQQ